MFRLFFILTFLFFSHNVLSACKSNNYSFSGPTPQAVIASAVASYPCPYGSYCSYQHLGGYNVRRTYCGSASELPTSCEPLTDGCLRFGPNREPLDEPEPDACENIGKDGVDGWRVVGDKCVFSHDFCETAGNIELYHTCNQTVCRADQITLPSGFCLDNPNQSCNPNSPDYVGTFASGIHLCNGDSAPEGFDPLNDPACSVQTGTVNGDRYTYIKCNTQEENAALGDDALPDTCGKDKVFLNGSCQSTPLVSDVYDDEAIVLHEDGTSTKTTTSTTKSTDKTTGETTTTTTKTITNYDANGAEVGSETSTENKTEKSTAHGGASCEVAPACTGDAVQCAILHQTWLNRCSSQSEKVTLDSIDFGTSDIQGGGDFQSVELIGEDNKEAHDVSAIFSNLPAVGSTSASCPVMNLELGAPYGTLNFDFKPICDFGDYTRPLFSAIGYFILGMFLFATLRRL